MNAIGAMDPELREAIELNRAKTETLTAEVRVLQTVVVGIEEKLEEKHGQNRRDIHRLGNTLATFMEKWHLMQIAQAKDKGYWLGVGGVCVVIAEIAKLVLEHYWK